jgi:hypothetical protein
MTTPRDDEDPDREDADLEDGDLEDASADEEPGGRRKRSGSRRRRPSRVGRELGPGAVRSAQTGGERRVLLVARTQEEWVGVDLDNAAYVRFARPAAEALRSLRPGHAVLEVTLAKSSSPLDPVRPESVELAGEPRPLPPPRRRARRRLLESLLAKEATGASLLGSRGPSVAFVDLDPGAPSLVLVRASRRMEVVAQGEEALAEVRYGGVVQQLPVDDTRVRRAAFASAPRPLSGSALEAALGFRIDYLVVGFDRVEMGHARKAVLGVLER